jgi:hypothetical protein
MGLEDLIGDIGGDLGDFFGGGPGAEAVGAPVGDLIGDVGGRVGDVAQAALPAIEDAGRSVGTFLPEGVGRDTGAGGVGDVAGKVWGGVKEGWQGAKDVGGGLAGFAKGALPFAQLGATGLGVASTIKAQQQAAEQMKIQKRAQGLQEAAAVPLSNFGQAELRHAEAGQVPQAVQAQIDLWKQGAKQKARDYLARAGIADSSTAAQWDAWIDQQGEAMKVQALQSESQQGIAALQASGGQAGQMGQSAAQQQGSLENLIAQANQALGRLGGSTA